ncbi:MAG: ABC transporter permease [Deltaproteobacteria bacterium RIFOXYD12_FULL_57_12]|nr:MAG: ABC transporter permease [Deltaproteobacteria bacterium RIFOXYD12_FULL_57_12]
MRQFRYSPALLPETPSLNAGDVFILLLIVSMLYAGQRLAFNAPQEILGPEISLSPLALPWYALLSVRRMAAAYILSIIFSLFYGYAAARNRSARSVLMPLLDVLQSVPILSFLPMVLLSLTAVMPERRAAELAAVLLIFTSQAWNITFSFYQSMTTIPLELREAAAIFRFDPWTRFTTMELPFAGIGLLWNSMMSWSGGWFFLMAAEIFHVGSRDFRLPGLGSYLQTAANQADAGAVCMGMGTLVCLIVFLDQCVWRPLTAWADKFKVEMQERDEPPSSWVFDMLSRSWLLEQFGQRVWAPLGEWLHRACRRCLAGTIQPPEPAPERVAFSFPVYGLLLAMVVLALYGSYRASLVLLTLPGASWFLLAKGLVATFCRVALSLCLALLWTIPVGVAIGTNRRLANFLQPVVQVVAAVPATALFPVLLLGFLRVPGGLNIAAIALMLMGTQWYLLFNIIAGASAIPQDLWNTTKLLRLSTVDRWRILILPALFPYIVTGAITASGGAWNASIVAEYVEFGGTTHATIGVGALIAQATASGNYPLLLASTLVLIMTVVFINRTFWLRLYRLAEERFRME